jgi:hypothetical protein
MHYIELGGKKSYLYKKKKKFIQANPNLGKNLFSLFSLLLSHHFLVVLAPG